MSSVDEWDQRELCPNDTCIGVLGADGKCRTCGAVGNGGTDSATDPGSDTDTDTGSDTDSDTDSDTATATDTDTGSDTDSDTDSADAGTDANGVAIATAEPYRTEGDDWSTRELCENGACVGVVHAGVCNVCGARSKG